MNEAKIGKRYFWRLKIAKKVYNSGILAEFNNRGNAVLQDNKGIFWEVPLDALLVKLPKGYKK